MNVSGKVRLQIIVPWSPLMSVAPASGIQVWDSQPISTVVAMVATVLGASFRFSMCPDIWLSSSTAYLNMKGTITLVIWEGRAGEEEVGGGVREEESSLLDTCTINSNTISLVLYSASSFIPTWISSCADSKSGINQFTGRLKEMYVSTVCIHVCCVHSS